MLHLAHQLARRHGAQGRTPIAAWLLLASCLMLLLGMGLLVSGRVAAQTPASASNEEGIRIATRLLDHLDAGEYAQAEAMFTPEMAKAVPADKLKAVWESLPGQVGKATGRGAMQASAQGGSTLVLVPLHYQNAELVARVAISAEGKIEGFLIQPAQAAPPPSPAVSTDAPFTERGVMVGTGERALPATLSLPKGNGPFPAVVLVHGSGPQDRDETIGANRPFLDIARGLAAQGIAALRYDKRTKARPQDYANGDVNIDNETTDDAVAALATLRAQPGIDPARVFVLGHSQGGMMAPRIAMQDGKTAGLILLAAPARNLLDILMEQNVRLLGMQGVQDTPEGIAYLDKMKNQIANVRGAGDAAIGTPLGLPVAYWRSVDGVDPVAEARKAGEPMLILHGGHDIQVVDADWQAWQAAFGNDQDVTMKRYPTLNHLAIESEAGAGLESYQKPGHVDAALIDDIARWIKAGP